MTFLLTCEVLSKDKGLEGDRFGMGIEVRLQQHVADVFVANAFTDQSRRTLRRNSDDERL